MYNQTKTRFLFYTLTLFVCLNSFFLMTTAAQVNITPVAAPDDSNYTYESIDVEGVDYLALTASSDFEDYAGYTLDPDGKTVAFTLIDGVFATYDFPDSQETRFYALGNNGDAAGYYVDSDGHHRGIVLENGEWRQYDFPDSVETELWGISDTTGKLTGNFIDASSVRRGFSGDLIIEYPGASETYADFVNSRGLMVGSYVDVDGIYHAYARLPDGRFLSIDLENAAELEYFFVHGINDVGTIVARAKRVGAVPLTYIGTVHQGLQEFKVPGSVSTKGYNINQDGSIVGNYDTPDGRTHGFIAGPVGDDAPVVPSAVLTYTFESIDVPGVDFLELTASSDFEDYAGNTRSADGEKMVGFTLIDGVFTTYDFPGSTNTYFYAFGNNGQAAGHYEDSDGLFHGVILENGELTQYDFPGAVETFIYGISDATGVLTGSFIDAEGIRRGFSGETIVEYPGATATYADFVNASGRMVGSYVDAEGIYHAYVRTPDNRFTITDHENAAELEYYFLHGISDAGIFVGRTKAVGDVPRTFIGTAQHGQQELRFPGSVSTEGWNINQDSSVVGYYDTADGRRHGFVARQVGTDGPVVAPAQVHITPVAAPDDSEYTFERIDVEDVDFLALTASSDFEDYAGYTRSPDGKTVGFTIIDDVFTTYDFPGAQETRFYALSNDRRAAGYYVDSDGHHRGVVLENGELTQYDFSGAVQTEIYGIGDATGALTGNFIDASGVRRGFSGDLIIEAPGATATFADFVNTQGVIVGSYIDADGAYQAYMRTPDERFAFLPLPKGLNLEYLFLHGINDAGVLVLRLDGGRGPRTMTGPFDVMHTLRFPGAVSTEGWNINQDGSVVGYYNTADGRRYGFIARPVSGDDPVVAPARPTYTFESIDVEGVDYLEVTASSDFEDYAGNTRSPDGEKTVAFTLIDGVFTTYDFPGSQNTYFYALGNDGQAAGHYEDSDGLFHGVILENGELTQYDFPGAVQTFLYGYSDATGALTGDFIDADGVQRGFSGDLIIDIPGATATHTDFVNAEGSIVGSYVDVEGTYHAYVRLRNGSFATVDLPTKGLTLEYFFVHGISDTRSIVARAKAVGDVPRTYVGQYVLHELQFPDAVSTQGYNINQDGSVVGHYQSADGRTHGFIARLTAKEDSVDFSNVYNVTLAKGLNMISLPLAPPTPMNAENLAELTGATTVITLDTAAQRFVGWTPDAPDAGFAIEGGKGYIVNVLQPRDVAFTGAAWTTPTKGTAAAPAISVETSQEQGAWAFVVSGHLEGQPAFDGYQVIVHNLRTNSTLTAPVQGGYFAAATADLSRRSVVEVGDRMEVHVIGPDGNIESDTLRFKVTPADLANAVLSIRLDRIGQPKLTRLLQNFPNPFNPETWIPYQLEKSADVTLQIYDTTGGIVRTLDLGFKGQGFYMTRATAAYWDGRNNMGEPVASGVYFYSLQTPDFSATRKMLILK